MSMNTPTRRTDALRDVICAMLALAVLLATPLARADEHSAAGGDAQPIAAVLERFHADFGEARILEIELDTEQSGNRTRLVYEIKAFTERGAVLKILYDARTLERLAVKGRREHREQDD
jgi:predicted outer membrane protein